ncbi:MAG TPA: alpha-2-macroglobulin family protein [Pyrinomonadaceae bacterium]|nr:alpha-2-macroglobulin family protein [Pyrinomonadaceae bacterium]
MTLPRRFVSLLLLCCFAVSVAPHPRIAISTAPTRTVQDDDSDEDEGLSFRLSEGSNQTDRPELPRVTTPAPATVLSNAETEAVLKRLPPITASTSDETDFAWRKQSLPPPRMGFTVMKPFPAANEIDAPEPTTAETLEVVRYSPHGEVPIASNLSITFSQPMIAVSSQEEAAKYVPVKLSPEPAGKWRWIGTRTLLFEPDGHLPMATQYEVSVPAATKSATGGTLNAAKSWTFATPPPTVKTTYPGDKTTHSLDTLMFVELDQRIDPAAVLKTIRVTAGNTQLPVRLATPEEIERDQKVKELAQNAQKDRWLAFRAIAANGDTNSALPSNSQITVTIGPGTPSSEGARTTAAKHEFRFSTFGPLRITSTACGHTNLCNPYADWRIEFNNEIDAKAFTESQVSIHPASSELKLSIRGKDLIISGYKQPDTTFRITVDKSIRDVFGQTAGKDETREFKVGPVGPFISLAGGQFVVLDPNGPRTLSLYTTNYQTVKVSLYAVEPTDWIRFQVYRQLHYRGPNDPVGQKAVLPGRLVYSKQIDLRSSPNQMIATDIDLAPAFKDGLGHAIVVVESITPTADRFRSPLLSWVQSTRIGLDAFVDNKQLIGWANSLTDGAPLTDVKMQIIPSNVSGTTGTDGLAHLPLKPVADSEMSVLIARRGNDVAILPENAYSWWQRGSWHQKPQTDELLWYIFDDRELYRPGEEVHIKGWIRRLGMGSNGDVGPLNGAIKALNYVIEDEREIEISKGELKVNNFGGFDVAFKLPEDVNLGMATVKFETRSTMKAFDNEDFSHHFQVQEFRRPEFEVTARNETEGPLFVGGHADVSVMANYFAGGGLANAEVEWSVKSVPTNFTPPNRSDYTFGKWTPWWAFDSEDDGNTESFDGETDESGKHRLRIDFDSVNPPRPSLLDAEASVKDVNRQTWTSTATMLVHPANLYVGLRSEKTFVQQGEPFVVQTLVTDLDGKAIANREVKMHAALLDWKQVAGEWIEVESNRQDCVVQSTNDAVRCTFTSKAGGRYRVVATIRDDRGRANQSEISVWVAGGKRPPRRGLEETKVELIPDRKEYKAGDTAEILVQAPFYPAEAAMTLRRSGIASVVRFRIDGPTYTLRLPIEEAWTPNVHVQVDLVGVEKHSGQDGAAAEMRVPAFASGEINLSIPPFSRRLNVVAAPREKILEPSGKTVIDVEVKDALGKHVGNSEVAVVVVDESVLALTEYVLSDPLTVFYDERTADTQDYHSRTHLLISDPAVGSGYGLGLGVGATTETVTVSAGRVRHRSALSLMLPNEGIINNVMLDGFDKADRPKIALRHNFDALATFAPSVRTDANGRAQVQVKLPDNLTRYRVMAVAVAGDNKFGAGESAITARLPLMARPSAPRFLNFGDRFELPIVLQNQTDAPMAVDVAVRATNAALVQNQMGESNTAGRRVTVPANDRVEVRIPAATLKAGVARFQIGAVSGSWSDAAEVELPVWTPATSEAFATYGEIDNGAINQPVKAPENVFTQFGGLQIETSSTQLQQLTDAVIYLTTYPYECSEQLASRIITIAALRDVLTAFKTKDLPSPQAMEAAVVRDLKRLQGMQNEDGGFGFWQRGDESWPYISLHVAHALARAKQKKFDVPSEMFEKSEKYLREIEKHIPSNYGVDARRAIISYALYVRAQMGDRDASGARNLIAQAGVEKLSMESLGWLLSVLSNDADSRDEVAAIRRVLNNRVAETAGTAHFVSSYSDDDYLLLNSNRRADGVILEALIMDQPSSDLIPKIVRGLLAHRTRGRWENTQENVFILLALDRYFNTFEKVTPNFVARAWLGERFAGEQVFRGRSTDRQQVNVPMRHLAQGTPNLVIDKSGTGRLYYRVSMNYAPNDLDLKPADYGFTVERSYEAVDHPEDVTRDADGKWHIKAGARVRVRLTMVAPARRYHVALVDPLPAGFEALNPSLATTGSIPRDVKQTGVVEYGGRSYGYGWWWWRPEWFEHQNLRDERAEAFASLLWEGVYKYSYVARATTPGDFIVPPPKAEEMYHPETFGRGKTDRVRVE